MFKKFVAALAVLFAATAFAAVDVNKATQAELEAIKGIGPTISAAMIDERKKSQFKDWTDLVTRVKGVGDRSAANFSEAGLTVNGKPYPGAPVAKPASAASSNKAVASVKSNTKAASAPAAKTAASAPAAKTAAASAPKK